MRYQLYIMCFYQIADFFSIGIDLFSIADFHADFCYLFQIVERTWTPPSTEGDKNKSRKRLHLRCWIGTFLFCFLCIDTSTAAASSSPARGPAVLTALPSSLLLSQPCLHFGRQPQHSSYELVPADVAHCIRFNSKVFAGTPQQALLKAYEEAAAEEE